ncbi:penicillin-binding protein 2 [Arcobacter sp. FWKO B]|uniref:penicillin-binding protein 2 n=1 Tax=Arcobacter sp. FWKO B TaxID=2593672 RepID=UPI0018A4A418|nr:penicillin-binding protein 2 [Arcobacter sp. FWKO B]QOG12989.1 penicillin-binding protein 2 [Arcobacter sp. FWKO B]
MRIKLIVYFISFIMLLIIIRVYNISIKSNTYYDELSKQNHIKKVYQAPTRGIIRDRNGIPIAINNVGFSLSLKPHMTSSNSIQELERIAELISDHFKEYSKDDIIDRYKRQNSPYRHDYISVVDFISYEDFFPKFTLFNSIDNLQISDATKRFYPYGEVGAHIIGYVGKANRVDFNNDEVTKYTSIIGKTGLEQQYNSILQGKLGYKEIKVNALNQEIEVIDFVSPSNNNDIVTTIDINLQKYIHEIFRGKGGVVVVQDVQNGEILAAASFPEYDNNIFVSGISHEQWQEMRNDFNNPFANKIINGLYPPGSVIKMGVALSFLENGLGRNFNVYCSGEILVGNRRFRCWKDEGHGRTDYVKAIAESCDVFFYEGSLKIGISKIAQSLQKLGFGEKTGVDLPNEFVGINPSREWKISRYNKPWFIGETINTSIGQGYFLVTPLQVSRFTSYLASGVLTTPHFVKNDNVEAIELDYLSRDLELMRKGMYETANTSVGTATRHIRTKVPLAAKTGTAQVVGIPQDQKQRMKEDELEYYQRSHAWLTTYGPYDSPQYSVTVLKEHGGYGASATGYEVSKIFDKLIELGYIK